MDPSGCVEAADRRLAARPGPASTRSRQLIADELGLAPGTRPRRPRRHRPRRPTAGAPSPAARWSSRAAPASSPPSSCAAKLAAIAGHAARGRGRRHRARRRRGAACAARDLAIDIADAGARRLPPEPSLRPTTSTRPDGPRDLRSRRHLSPTPAMSRSSRSTSRPAAWRSSGSSWSRTPGVLDQPDDRRRPDPAAGSRRASPTRCSRSCVYDAAGNILTASLADYLPPTCAEIPPIEIHHLETTTDASVTRAKGLGEGGAIGAPAAVLNAISDALAPVRRRACSRCRRPRSASGICDPGARTESMRMTSARSTWSSTVNGATLRGRGRAAPHARRRAPRGLRPHRHASRLRARRLRRLHGAGRRRAGALLPDVRGAGRRRGDPHRRGARERRRSCTRCSRRSGTTTACSAASARRAS